MRYMNICTPIAKSAFVFVIFLLAGCTRSSQDGRTPIRIAYPSSGTIINAQVGLIFEKTKILEQNGFSATLHPLSTGREMKSALVSGAVDVILTSEANFVV